MQAVVMAGGTGTRLRPLTTSTPKALLPLVGEPMLARVIEHLVANGVTTCVVTLQHQASTILKYFSSDAVNGISLRFLTEPRPLGTAGSVAYARSWLEDDDTIVISGDCLTDMDLQHLVWSHRERQADLTIALARRADPRSYGVVSLDDAGKVMSLVEKPTWAEVADDTVNTGVYVVSPRLMAELTADDPVDWANDVIPRLLREGRPVYGEIVDAYWEDVGGFASYARAHRDVLDGAVRTRVDAFEVSPGVLVAAGAEVSPEAELVAPCYVGPFAKIESEAVIGPYTVVGTNALVRARAVVEHAVLHPNVFVGNDAELRGCIVGRATEVRDGVRILDGSVVADNCTLLDGSVIGTDVLIYPGKTIDEGTVVDESVVWESPTQRQVFTDKGVRGIVNVDMTPERIVRLAGAFATILPKGATVSLGRDHSKAARSLNRALAGALTSAGCTIRDLRTAVAPLIRSDTSRHSDGGVILRTTPGRPDSIDCMFLNSSGGELDPGPREALERIYTRKEFRRPLPTDIGDIRTPHRVLDDYVHDLERLVDLDAIRGASLRLVVDAGGGPAIAPLASILGNMAIDALTVGASTQEQAAADTPALREAAMRRLSGLVVSSGANLGLRVGPMGERLSVVDNLGHVVDDGRMLLVFLDLLAAQRRHGTFAVPVTASRLAEQVADFHGVGVRRIGTGPAALASAATHGDVLLAGDGRGRFVLPAMGPGPDAIAALVTLLSLIAATDLSLAQLNARIPETAMVRRAVSVAWHLRGSAMRAVRQAAADYVVDATDGLRITEPNGDWCLVVPSDDQAVFDMHAEAATREDALAIIDRWQVVVESVH